MEKKKTLGVTATAVYGALSGLFIFPVGVLLLIFSGTQAGNLYFMLGGLVFSLLGVFILASVYGLWTLQEWGRKLTIWLSVISMVLGLISIFPIWPDQHFTLANTLLQLFGKLLGQDTSHLPLTDQDRLKTLSNWYGVDTMSQMAWLFGVLAVGCGIGTILVFLE